MHTPDSVMLAGTFIPLLTILMSGLLLMIPVAGITVRFALKPALETIAHIKEIRSTSAANHLLERRLEILEQQLQSMAVLRLLEAGEAQAGDSGAQITFGPASR